MFFTLLQLSFSVEYTLSATELVISGEGVITRTGVSSKGSVSLIPKVIIEEGPYKIDDDAFSDCTQLKEINIPKSIALMGQPFALLQYLTKIVVDPENEEFCNDDNFILYNKLKTQLIRAPSIRDLEIPDTVEMVQPNAFRANGFNYGNVVFPASLVNLNINSFAVSVFDSVSFKEGSKLESLIGFTWSTIQTLTIPKSVTKICSSAFSSAVIGEIIFETGSKLETIENTAFSSFSCSSISLPDNLKTIGYSAFIESTLETIKIGSGCSSIDMTAFSGCKKLKQIIVSENNTHYSSKEGVLMNSDKTQLIFIPPNSETVTILSSVKSIGQTMLQSSPNLTNIVFDGENSLWSTKDGVLYSKDFTQLIAVCGGVIKVQAHSSVTTICNFAAYGCSNLLTFEFLGSSVSVIGSNAFAQSSLSSFALPSSVTSIGSNAFSGLSNLKDFVTKEDSLLTTIPGNCFRESSRINSFTFSKNIQTISYGGFYYCTNLSEIIFPPDSKIDFIGEIAFESTSLTKISIPLGIKTLMKRCFSLCSALETVTFDKNSELIEIPEISFEGCTNLWKIVLPDKCTTLGTSVFRNCYNLSSIEHKLTTIGNTAFENCFSLKTFTFSEKQTKSLNPGIFKNCYNLLYFHVETGNADIVSNQGIVYDTNINILYLFPPGQEMAKIPSSVLQFADTAFAFSPKLKFVAFVSGSNLETIGKQAFYDCKHLETVQFPSKLTTIKTGCFFGCSSLGSVVFPPTIATIETDAFIGCEKLRHVKYCGTNFVNGENVFENFVVVSVTDLYENSLFCNIKVSKRLNYDCELKVALLPTCRVQFNTVISFRLLASALFLYSF